MLAARTPRLKAAAATALLVVTAACTGAPVAFDEPAPPDDGASLDGRSFLSEQVTEGGEPRLLDADTQIHLAFDEGRVNAAAGCNTIVGAYTVDDGALTVDGLAMTEMGCPRRLHAQDDWLAGLLASGPLLWLDGDELTLRTADTEVTLLDRRAADPDRPLAGTTWQLEELIEGDAVSSVPGGVTASLELGDDGRLEVDSGCNTGSGTATVEDGALVVDQLVTTDMACGPDADMVEETVHAVLGASPAVEIDGPRLLLDAGGRGLGWRAAE